MSSRQWKMFIRLLSKTANICAIHLRLFSFVVKHIRIQRSRNVSFLFLLSCEFKKRRRNYV